MREQSKSAKRRFNDGAFHSRYFVGQGIDIGGKPDPLGQYAGIFRLMQSARTWDLADGDAQFMAGVPDNTFDFVHSSHCLEHMVDARVALENWTRILKPGGYLIVTIPDEDLYEQGQWPSRFNPDHKWTFTMAKPASWSPRSLNMVDLVKHLADQLSLERLVRQVDFYRSAPPGQVVDQTMTPVAECAIEVIWQKRRPGVQPVAPK
jgi:SAM-dependent methyltransferase